MTAVRTWPIPNTFKELQRFLGFAKFYHKFFKDFKTTVTPITDLIRSKRKFKSWCPLAIEAFNLLKKKLSSASLLRHPDPTTPFIVEVDASSTGVGSVLSQRQGTSPVPSMCLLFSETHPDGGPDRRCSFPDSIF